MMSEFYYWMYRGLRKIRKEEDPSYDAMLGVLFFMGLNMTVIGRFIHNLTNFTMPKNDIKIIGVIIAIISVIIGYFGLYKRRDQIFYKMNLLRNERLKRGKFFFIIYIILSIVFFLHNDNVFLI